MTNSYIQEILSDLEVAGILVRTGERRNPKTGELRPAYVSAVSLGLMSEQETQRRLKLLAENDRRPPQ
jgi:hypothetical protein